MAKYTTVYVRNKKESSISLPLRYSFLRSIFVHNMSVKDVPSFSFRPPPSGRSTIPLQKSSPERHAGTNSTPCLKKIMWCQHRSSSAATGILRTQKQRTKWFRRRRSQTTPTMEIVWPTSQAMWATKYKYTAPLGGTSTSASSKPPSDILFLFFYQDSTASRRQFMK